MFESDQSRRNEGWCPFIRECQRHMYHRCHMRDGTYLWRPRYSSSGWRRETRDRYMRGSALCSDVGFPSTTIMGTKRSSTDIRCPRPEDHCWNILRGEVAPEQGG